MVFKICVFNEDCFDNVKCDVINNCKCDVGFDFLDLFYIVGFNVVFVCRGKLWVIDMIINMIWYGWF